jgi:hypothetical protein
MHSHFPNLPLPQRGVDATFDEFVSTELSRYDDFLQEEANSQYEYLEFVGCDGREIAAAMANWWRERESQLRAELWPVWHFPPTATEDVHDTTQESVSLREQLVRQSQRIRDLESQLESERTQRLTAEAAAWQAGQEVEHHYHQTLRLESRLLDWNVPLPCSCGSMSYRCARCGDPMRRS